MSAVEQILTAEQAVSVVKGWIAEGMPEGAIVVRAARLIVEVDTAQQVELWARACGADQLPLGASEVWMPAMHVRGLHGWVLEVRCRGSLPALDLRVLRKPGGMPS